MPILHPVIRPPSEANSVLIQVTVGCSANTCAFCGAYRGKTYRVKKIEEISRDIEESSRHEPDARRIFLLDGDALAVPNGRLIPILEKIGQDFPLLSRIASYANGFNLTGRSAQELKELADRKMRLIYIGLESGSQAVLDRCGKRATVEEMVRGVRGAAQAGIKSSVIVLLGLGGKQFSEEHVDGTIRALNEMQPRYLSFLSLMLMPHTVLHQQMKRGIFQELDAQELLTEAIRIIEGLDLDGTIFRSDHASNYLALEGRFPQDKNKLLEILKAARAGNITLRPDFLRAL